MARLQLVSLVACGLAMVRVGGGEREPRWVSMPVCVSLTLLAIMMAPRGSSLVVLLTVFEGSLSQHVIQR
jgi:hypothetical protein